MKALALCFLIFSTIPSLAMANYCREQSATIGDREACERRLKVSGVQVVGDWGISSEVDNDGKSIEVAVNRPIFFTKAALKPNTTKALNLQCMGSVPLLTVFTGGLINRSLSILYKFDNDPYQDLSEAVAYDVYEDSVISTSGLTGTEFIDNVLSKSILALKIELSDGGVAEYFYTLNGGGEMRERISCI